VIGPRSRCDEAEGWRVDDDNGGSGRIVKLGLFIPIGNNGWVVSASAPQYMPTFELNRTLTKRAEDAGADFVFSMGKWRGFGGATEHWDHTMESLTLMAGLAAVTERIDLYATVHPLLVHPAVAAKMLTTIDDISGGRAGVNVVTGWNKFEFSQMGLWPGDDYFGRRYEYAAEWVDVVKSLWRTGRVTHHGRYFQLDDCVSQPLPQRRPRPPIVCAGMSEAGLRFTIEQCDYGFVGGGAVIWELLARCRTIGAETGRVPRPIVLYTLVCEPTDAAATERAAQYKRGVDVDAVKGYADAASSDAEGSVSRHYEEFAFLTAALVGSPDTVVRHLVDLDRAGAHGILFALADPVRDLDMLFDEVFPRMQDAGLRAQPTAPAARSDATRSSS
jgi:pyrimidine oxygenase